MRIDSVKKARIVPPLHVPPYAPGVVMAVSLPLSVNSNAAMIRL